MSTIVTSISVFTSEWVQELLLITMEPIASLMLGKTHTREKWVGGLLTAPDTRRNVRCNRVVFLFTIFLMWTIFKVFIEFVTILLLLYVLVFWLLRMWNLSSPTRHRTHTCCFGRQNPKCWTAREVPWSGVLGTERGALPFENNEVINCENKVKQNNKNPIASNKPQSVEGLWVGDDNTTDDDNNWEHLTSFSVCSRKSVSTFYGH